MTNQICMPRNYFFILIIIFIILTYFHNLRMLVYYDNLSKKSVRSENNKLNLIDNSYSILTDVREKSKRQLLQERDNQVIYDDLHPPERRMPEHQYPDRYVKRLINIPTRGHPDNYHLQGVLTRKQDERILQLYGRQTYPSSNQWEYYVMGKDPSGQSIKVPFESNNKKELEEDQLVNIPIFDEDNGSFTVKLYKYDVPRYNPYL